MLDVLYRAHEYYNAQVLYNICVYMYMYIQYLDTSTYTSSMKCILIMK